MGVGACSRGRLQPLPPGMAQEADGDWKRPTSPEVQLLWDKTLPRPGPLQSDWVRRGVPRGGNARKKAEVTVRPAENRRGALIVSPLRDLLGAGGAGSSGGAGGLGGASSTGAMGLSAAPRGASRGTPKKVTRVKSAPPVASPSAGAGAGRGGGPNLPAVSSKSRAALAWEKVTAQSPLGKLSSRSGVSAASTAVPGADQGGGSLSMSSPALTSRSKSTPLKPGTTGPDSPAASNKVWVTLEGPDGETCRVRVKVRSTVSDLRKAVGAKTAVPLKDLNLKVGDKILEVARKPAFEGIDVADVVIFWWRSDRLKELMEKRKLADHFSRGWLGRTILHYTVLDGDFGLCLEVCNKDYAPELMNVQDFLGDTALMFASVCGYDDIVELLMDRQAEPDYTNLCGRTALMLAAEHGQYKTEKTLLTANARRGPNIGFRRPDEVYLAELNDRISALKSIHDYEVSQAAAAALGF